MSKTNQSPEQLKAIEEWLERINPPMSVRDGMRTKFYKLNMTVEEIRHDMNAKLARLTKKEA